MSLGASVPWSNSIKTLIKLQGSPGLCSYLLTSIHLPCKGTSILQILFLYFWIAYYFCFPPPNLLPSFQDWIFTYFSRCFPIPSPLEGVLNFKHLSQSLLWVRPSTCPDRYQEFLTVLCHESLWKLGETHASDENMGLQGRQIILKYNFQTTLKIMI